MDKVKLAQERFSDGFNCAQSIFSVYAEEMGLDIRIANRITTGFGGGILGTGATCGLITGGLMAIGLKCGKELADDDESKAKTYELGNEFVTKLNGLHSSIECNGLLGCDITTPEGKEYIKTNNSKEKVCMCVMKDAIEALDKVLNF